MSTLLYSAALLPTQTQSISVVSIELMQTASTSTQFYEII